MEKCWYIIWLSKHLCWQFVVLNSATPDRLSDGTDRWTFHAAVMAGFTEQWEVCALHKAVTCGSLTYVSLRHLSGPVAVKHPVLSIETFHSGEQYPWSDARGSLTSALNERSIRTEEASVQIGFESNFKPPHDVVWIWFEKIRFHLFFAVQTSWNQSGDNLTMQKSPIWVGSLNKALKRQSTVV